MDRLGRLTRTDRDDLGEVQLVAGRMGQDPIDDVEDTPMGDEGPSRLGAGHQSPGSPGLSAAEVVRSGGHRVEVWRHLVERSGHQIRVGKAIDHRAAVGGERSGDGVGIDIGCEVLDGHAGNPMQLRRIGTSG